MLKCRREIFPKILSALTILGSALALSVQAAPPKPQDPAPTATATATATASPTPSLTPAPTHTPTPNGVDWEDPFGEYEGVPPSPIELYLGDDMVRLLRITTSDIWASPNGSIQSAMEQESDALILARVALGEAPSNINDRYYIMWNIRLRAELGYKMAGYYSGNREIFDRWGEPTTIQYEALCNNGCQYAPIKALEGVYFPLQVKGHLKKMIFPSDEDLMDVYTTYMMALEIMSADFVTGFPDQLKGYDGFRSQSVTWIGKIDWYGGKSSIQFFGYGSNVWRDEQNKDNIFWSINPASEMPPG